MLSELKNGVRNRSRKVPDTFFEARPDTFFEARRQVRGFFRWRIDPLLRGIASRAKLCAGVSVALLLGAAAVLIAFRGQVLAMESDLTVMHPRPNPALEAQADLSRM